MTRESIRTLLEANIHEGKDKTVLKNNLTQKLMVAGTWFKFDVMVNLNNNEIKTTGIFTRQCYLDLYNALLKPPEKFMNLPFYVVSGTSGIGKSTFGLYFVLRKIFEGIKDDKAKSRLCWCSGNSFIDIEINH